MRTHKPANIEQNPDGNSMVRPSPFRRSVAWITLIAYIGQPMIVSAEVIANQAAATNNRPTVDVTANGLPLVQIATPNSAGLSHNQYTQFNVGPEGVILNNSQAIVQTQQAGYVGANQNLANGSARIILNEVNGTSRSQLNGYTEVAGPQAEVIIANPNGITCNGCGFINTSRGVLTTGTPVIGSGGSLDYFRVTGGDIQIGSAGLNAGNISQLDLIARSVQVNGQIWANNLNVITGANQVDYSTLGVQIIAGDANKPTVGIDVALLGGMYANKIRLIGTEAGVGVNSLGTLAAQAGDFTLDNQGQITLGGSTTANGNIGINSNTGITNSGTLYSKQASQLISSGTITNTGLLSAGGNLTLNANSLNSTGSLGAGIDTSGTATQNGNLTINTQGQTAANGTNVAGSNMSITASSINLAGSQTSAWSGIDLNATAGDIDNSNGTLITMLGLAKFNASGNFSNGGGQVGSGQDISITAATLTGNGHIVAGRDASITLQGNYTNAVGNVILANRDLTLNTTGGTLTNQAALQAVGNLTLNSAGLDNQTGAQINSNHTTLNIGAGDITNAGRIEGNIVDTHSNNLTNTGTVMGDVLNLNANNLSNLGANALIGATGTINLIIANALLNQSDALDPQTVGASRPKVATIFSLGDINIGSSLAIDPLGYLSGNAVSVTNSSATIEAWGNLRISADTITNQRKVLDIGVNSWTGTPVVGTPSYNGTGGSPSYTPTFTEEYLAPTTTVEGWIQVGGNAGGGNAWLKSNSINNNYSTIAIAGTETFSTTLLQQTARDLMKVETRVETQNNYVWEATGWHWSMCGGGGFPPSPPYPCTVTDYGWVNHPTSKTVTDSTVVGTINATHTATVIQGSAGDINNQTVSPGVVGGTGGGTGGAGNTAGTITVPSSGLYTIHPQPGQNYLITTDPRFTDYQNFVSSDYMLSRLSLDPLLVQKRLGDGFYEQKLVLDQITELTGRRFLAQSTDANEQYIALLESGVDAASEFKLTLGVALTPEQINSLKHDIVWLVDQAVSLPDGSIQHVLAPKVYLTRLHEADLKPSGALIAADVIDIKLAKAEQPEQAHGDLITHTDAKEGFVSIDDANLNMRRNDEIIARIAVPTDGFSKSFIRKPIPQPFVASGTLTNSGTIRANNSLSIDAEDIVNRGGTISSGGSLNLYASNDVLNQSGNINGRTVTLNAGRDIVSERLTETISGSGQPQSATGFGKFMLNIPAPAQGGYTTTLVQGAAGISATEGLDITAGRDISLTASNINAGGNATLNAGGDLNVRTATATETTNNGVISTNHIEQLTGSITTGGNLTLISGKDMHLTSAAMEVGKDATLVAGGDLTLDASKNVSSISVDTQTTKVRRYDETVLGSSLNAGGNVILVATKLKNDQRGAENEATANSGAGISDGNASTEPKTNGNITLNSTTITSKTGNITVAADANVNIGITEEKHESFSESNRDSKGSGFTTTHSTVRDETWRTDTIGSTLSGDNISITSGKDINVVGSNATAEHNINVAAIGDVNISAATATYGSDHYSHETNTGLQFSTSNVFSVTDSGPDITTQAHTDGTKQSFNRSSFTSNSGNLNIMSGGNLIASGTDLAANAGELALTAGGTVAMLAGQDTLNQSSSTVTVTNPNFFTKQHHTIADTSASLDYQGSTAQGKSVKVSSGADTILQAADVKAGEGGISIDAGGDIKLLAATNQSSHTHTDKLSTDGIGIKADGTPDDTAVRRRNDKTEGQTSTAQVTSLVSAGNITTHSGGDTLIEASTLDAKGSIDLSATGYAATYNEDGSIKTEGRDGTITFAAVKDSTYSNTVDSHNSMPWQSSSGGGELVETVKLANIKSGKGLSVDAKGGIVVDIPEVPKEAPAPVEPVVAEPIPTNGPDGKPLTDAQKAAIVAERAAKAAEKAAQAEAARKAHEEQRFNDHIQNLASQPGQAWIGQLAQMAKDKPDSVKLQQVNAALEHWNYAHDGMTPEATAVVAIVVAYFTAGAGSSAVGAATGTSATTAASTYVVTTAVVQAAITTLATQAATSLINNKGDVGKTLNDMGQSQNVKALVTAMLTAGVLAGLDKTINIGDGNSNTSLNNINAKSDFTLQLEKNVINNATGAVINHAMYGGDLQQQLEQSLKSSFIDTGAAMSANKIGDLYQDHTLNAFTHQLAHAVAGCAIGAAKADNCGAGALGAVVGELSAEWYGGNRSNGSINQPGFQTDTVNFAKMMAGIAVAITGGDAAAVNLAASTAGNAAENNYLNHQRPAMLRLSEAEQYDAAKEACAQGDSSACQVKVKLEQLSLSRDNQIAKDCTDTGSAACRAGIQAAVSNGSGIGKSSNGGLYVMSPEYASMTDGSAQDPSKAGINAILNEHQQWADVGTPALMLVPGTVGLVTSTAAVAAGGYHLGEGYAAYEAGDYGTGTANTAMGLLGIAGGLAGANASIGMTTSSMTDRAIAGTWDGAENLGLKNYSGDVNTSANAARNQYYGNGSSASLGTNTAGSSGAGIDWLKAYEDYAGVGDTAGVPFAGVKDASQYLQGIGVPRAQRVQILQSFEYETVNMRTASSSEYGMRYFDDVNAMASGRYLFETFPASRETLALPYQWNQMTNFTQWQIKPGASFIEGRAAAQGADLPGGQMQKFVPNLEDLLHP